MKKIADILLRFILVISILGSIFFYYYGKFISSKKILIQSEIVKLPQYPVERIKKVNAHSKSNVEHSKKDIKKKKYIIEIKEYPILTKVNKLKKILTNNNIPFEFNSEKKEAEFKRVFVGPFKSKIDLIKMENKLKKLGMETLRVKFRGAYFLHCGSYYFKEKAEELKNKLLKNGIKDIVIFEFKKPIEVYNVKIKNLDNKTFKIVKEFLSKSEIKFSVEK